MAKTSRSSVLGIAIRDIARLQQVSVTVARHGFGAILMRSPLRRFLTRKSASTEADAEMRETPAPERFRRLLEALGPTYIKLGQVLSMRPDRVPPEYIEALQKLQDSAPVLPFEEIRGVVEEGLKHPIESLFKQFDEAPLATASIAQTHLATTFDDQRVVVKVQRPGIEDVMRGDLDLLYLGARILEATIEEMGLFGPSEIVLEFERALVRELNFHVELNNLMTARALLDPDRDVVVPLPFSELSCRSVLTMEFFDGKPLRSLAPQSAEAEKAMEELVHVACKQVFTDGFFHGDPHSGNILVNQRGTLCLIDWGLVGRLDNSQRDELITIMLAIIANDVDAIARGLLRMGTPMDRVKMSEFKAAISRFRSENLLVAGLGEVDTNRVIQDFVSAAQRFQIKLATEYSVLAKAASTVEGLVRYLHPNVPMVPIAREYTEPLVKARFTPQRLMEEALTGVTGLGSMLRHLPGQVDQFLHDVETGNLQVKQRLHLTRLVRLEGSVYCVLGSIH